MGNITMKTLCRLIMTAFLLTVSTGTQAGLQEGIAAYNKGSYQAALNEFGPLAASGNAIAQLYLGRIYMQGLGSKPDYGKAISWTRKAAMKKNREAQYFLGFLYYYGLGAPQSYADAMSWYSKASELGNAKAQASVGSMFANGQGVPQDLVLAHKWFRLAVASGEADAGLKLKAAEENMTSKQIEEAEALAREWLSKHK